MDTSGNGTLGLEDFPAQLGMKKKHYLLNKRKTTTLSIVTLTKEQQHEFELQAKEELAEIARQEEKLLRRMDNQTRHVLRDQEGSVAAEDAHMFAEERALKAAQAEQRTAAKTLRVLNAQVKATASQLRAANMKVQKHMASVFKSYGDEVKGHQAMLAAEAVHALVAAETAVQLTPASSGEAALESAPFTVTAAAGTGAKVMV